VIFTKFSVFVFSSWFRRLSVILLFDFSLICLGVCLD